VSAPAAALLPLSLVAAAFLPLAGWFASRWSSDEGYFSHGPLVPLGAAWLAWGRREAIRRAITSGAGDWRALRVALPLALFAAAAAWLRVDSALAASLVALLMAVAWLASGTALLRALAMPLLFLGFMVPWPMEAVANAVQALKLFVLAAAGALLDAGGTGVTTSGSFLVLANGERLLVDDECSGLSSAIALVALSSFMAASAQRLTVTRRLVLLAAALPVALAANLIRVLLLALVGVASGAGAVGRWHDGANLLVYVTAIAAFVALERWLAPRGDAPPAADSAAPETEAAVGPAAAASRAPAHRGPARAAAAVALAALAAAVLLRSPLPPTGTLRVAALPQAVHGWSGRDVALTERQFRLLETRDVLLRRYGRDEASVLACVAVAGPERKPAHPPATCYRGQGFLVESEERVAATLAGRAREFTELVLAKDGERTLVWSWYRAGIAETASWWELQALAFVARLSRSDEPVALLRFSTALSSGGVDDAGLEVARRRLAGFLAAFLPAVDAALAPTIPCFVFPADG
jgi:EpsI family protein